MLIRQTIAYLPAQILAPTIQFITILVWAHILPLDQIGIATLIVAIQDVSFALFYMWWSQFSLRHLGRFRNQPNINNFLATEPVALAVAVTSQLIFLTPLVQWYFGSTIDFNLLVAICAYLATRSLNVCVAERARADVKVMLYTVMQVIVPTVGLVGGMIFVHSFGATAAAVLAAFAVAQGASLLIAFFASDLGRHGFNPDAVILRSAFAFGMPITVATLLSSLAVNAPRFVVDHYLGLSAAGMFAVAYGLGLRASSLASMSVTAGAYPLVVRKLEEEGMAAAYQQLRRNSTLLIAIVLPAAFGLIAISAPLVDLVFPPEFTVASSAILPLAALCGLLRDVRSHTTNQVFLLHGDTKFASAISFVDLILAVTLSIAGALWLGTLGAVVGPVVAAFAALITSVALANKRFEFSLPMREVFLIFAAATVMAVAVWALPATASAFLLGCKVAFGAILYVVLISFFLPRLRQEAFHRLRKRKVNPPIKIDI